MIWGYREKIIILLSINKSYGLILDWLSLKIDIYRLRSHKEFLCQDSKNFGA